MLATIKIPDSRIVRQAEELARSTHNACFYHHVMRCYFFGELFAQGKDARVDSEMMFLSAVLHDLGLTDHAKGPQRFEIEGADAARTFLVDQGVSLARAQGVWDNIALHTWDINLFRGDTSRYMELGIAYDVTGVPGAKLDPTDVAAVVHRYPRLNFKREFHRALEKDIDTKQPYPHWFHPCTRIEHNRSPLPITDMHSLMAGAPFDE